MGSTFLIGVGSRLSSIYEWMQGVRVCAQVVVSLCIYIGGRRFFQSRVGWMDFG